MDMVLCNNIAMVFKLTVGRVPLIDASNNSSIMQRVWRGLRRVVGMKLLPLRFSTFSGRKINTAASGCVIVQNQSQTMVSKMISHDDSLADGMISMVITAPTSILDYFLFLFQTVRCRGHRKRIPATIGYIKSQQITINSEIPLDVSIDGEKVTRTPVVCKKIAGAIRINLGSAVRPSRGEEKQLSERVEVQNLPAGREIGKATKKRIPFFSYASEERFRDLFISLREDATVHPSFLVLMVLSTMLAATGLYMSSSAVVIGAMLLAPLMAPIVALAMGLLRHDITMSKSSISTIGVGIFIALSAACLISLLFPHKPVTMEMQARLNPSLFDLAVAMVAGVAGAYTKSHREILQSLAGVSIAVALVPPLAVAGIGLGKAFLLFSTNLIGITLAATVTFRLLGYSPVVRDKWGLALMTMLMFLITIPLYYAYEELVNSTVLEQNWQHERFLINDKYLIVQQAELVHQRDEKLLFVRVLVREPLTRSDLNQLRTKIHVNSAEELNIRVQVLYIP